MCDCDHQGQRNLDWARYQLLRRERQRILDGLRGQVSYDDLVILADEEEIDYGRPFPEELR